MTVEELLQALDRKDNTEAYQALLELERLSSDSNVLYPYTEKFAEMTESDRNVVRVRGVRLFCSQAKWDSGSMIDRFLDQVLSVLQDDRPTTVRQTLAALQDVVRYKPELRDKIFEVRIVSDLKYRSGSGGNACEIPFRFSFRSAPGNKVEPSRAPQGFSWEGPVRFSLPGRRCHRWLEGIASLFPECLPQGCPEAAWSPCQECESYLYTRKP